MRWSSNNCYYYNVFTSVIANDLAGFLMVEAFFTFYLINNSTEKSPLQANLEVQQTF